MTITLVTVKCPECHQRAKVPASALPAVCNSRRHRRVVVMVVEEPKDHE